MKDDRDPLEGRAQKDRNLSSVLDMEPGVLANVRAMLDAPRRGIGPDIVIVVSSSDEGASFWQKRLTCSDDARGSGSVVKPSSVILSVSESNWNGPAGNALGTINAFYLAGIKAAGMGLFRPSSKGFQDVLKSFLSFSAGKSVFMYHTAGQGTRLFPLTAAEYNSKSRIKLPGVINVDGKEEPMTVLEASIRASSIYAPSREDRLSVFWGDQLFLNEFDAASERKHHVEIFAQPAKLDDTIKSYGTIVPMESGDLLLREKLDVARIKAMLPEGTDTVFRSAGSFSITFDFFEQLALAEIEAVTKREGSLNTDNDWWQALTSTLDEYADISRDIGVNGQGAKERWKKTHEAWEKTSFRRKSLKMLGIKNTGENSLWIDLGRNSCFFENILGLTGQDKRAQELRAFFQMKVTDRGRGAPGEMSWRNSAVAGALIGEGKLINCVVVASEIGEIDAEDSVIIGSSVTKLNSSGALCYNVVSPREDLKRGDILANVFHPDKGRITMRTHVSRDGRADWRENTKLGANKFSYRELTELVAGVPEDQARTIRQNEETLLKKGKDKNGN